MTRSFLIIPTLLTLAGCGGSSRQAAAPVNTGLANLAASSRQPAPVRPATPEPPPETALERRARESALDLQNVLDQMEKDRQKGAEPTPASLRLGGRPQAPANQPQTHQGAPPPATETASATTPMPAPMAEASTDVAAAQDAPKAPDAAIPPPEPERTLEQRTEDAVTLLVDLLRQRTTEGGDPRRAYLALAALECLRSGASQTVITPMAIGADPLSADDRAAVDEVRELMKSLAAAPPTRSIASVLREMADRAAMDEPVRLGPAHLCTRVLGFGRFTPFGGHRLPQGRPHRAIVYVELASFGQRTATEDEANMADVPGIEGRPRFAVDLTQSLELYHDADGVKAWTRPEQRILETSVNRRRDFYLVQQVTLPETLTIGAYKLKVIIRDRTTGSEDSVSIPLEIVAEPGLVEVR